MFRAPWASRPNLKSLKIGWRPFRPRSPNFCTPSARGAQDLMIYTILRISGLKIGPFLGARRRPKRVTFSIPGCLGGGAVAPEAPKTLLFIVFRESGLRATGVAPDVFQFARGLLLNSERRKSKISINCDVLGAPGGGSCGKIPSLAERRPPEIGLFLEGVLRPDIDNVAQTI